MQYFNEQMPPPRPRPQVEPPAQSPVPLGRGVWKRADPEYPLHVIVEIWTSTDECISCSRVAARVYALWLDRYVDALDVADPVSRYLRAI